MKRRVLFGMSMLALASVALVGAYLNGRSTYGNDGKPWPVPGRIEAENYDAGTWWDRTYGGTSGKKAPPDQFYRKGDVYIGVDRVLKLADVGWNRPGEWIEYTVEVKQTAKYDLRCRLATPDDGKSLQLFFDGKDVTGMIAIPNTGGWGSDLKGGHFFQEVTAKGIMLHTGVHRMRVGTATGGFTVDWFEWVRPPGQHE